MKKLYKVHGTYTFEVDQEIMAESEEEAIKIAEDEINCNYYNSYNSVTQQWSESIMSSAEAEEI